MMCLFSATVFAQSTADTEEQRHRAQQEAAERLLRQQAPDVRLQPPAPTVDIHTFDLPREAACFRIDHLNLDGARLEAFAWLQSYLAGYAGQCVGQQGIAQIVQRAAALIIAKGYITTRIGIPEQDLASGTLRLVVVPGVIRAIRIVDGAPDRNWQSAFPARPGDLLNLRDIEQGLEQMKRLPSQDVSIDIAPGEAAGESDIVLTVRRDKPWRLGLSLDDAGVKATGRLQASLNASYDNPLGLNDLFSASLGNDAEFDSPRRGTRSHGLQYSVPWGNWTGSLADSVSHYQQTIQGVNQTFRSSGDSHNQEIKVQRLVYRDQVAKTTVQFRLLDRESHSFIEDTEIIVQRRHTNAAELGIAHRQYLGAAQIDLALAYRQGVSWFGGQSDTAGRAADSPSFEYRMQTLDVTASTPFKVGTQSLRWLATLHGQTTSNVLYAADFISIGNRYTVRGFDGESTLAAECGWFLRNDLEAPLGDSGQALYIGLDYGQVSGPSAQVLAGRELTGAVLGLRGAGHGFNYDLFIGTALAKPDAFPTARTVAGFQLGYQL